MIFKSSAYTADINLALKTEFTLALHKLAPKFLIKPDTIKIFFKNVNLVFNIQLLFLFPNQSRIFNFVTFCVDASVQEKFRKETSQFCVFAGSKYYAKVVT